MEKLRPLIEAERPRLAEMLGEASFNLVEHHAGHCSLAADAFTVHFYRRPRGDVIDSSVELRVPPTHAVKLSDHLHTWLILKSLGEEWPQPAPESPASHWLSDELSRLSRALQIIRDEETMLEALLWEAGYRNGYLAWG